jgi:hypothetical protein
MKYLFSIATIIFLFLSTGCKQDPQQKAETTPQSNEKIADNANTGNPHNSGNTITDGDYICWLNSPGSPGGRRVVGDMWVKGNTYGDESQKGEYTYDPATRIVRFKGGKYDQTQNGEEWIGIFYKQGEQFIDSDGKAANTMLIITKAADWNAGLTQAWIQQCDLK